jgi:hypothetical protein
MNACASPARRRLLVQSALLLPLLVLPGCATTLGSYGVEEGVRRLLTLSSQRAFGRLTEPGGFYDDQLTRLTLPDTGGNDMLGAVLRTNAVRSRVAMALNDVAVDAAERATPVVLDSIRSMTVSDALAVLRGGPTAATSLLQRQVGGSLVEAMLPEFSSGLRSDALEILTAVAGARTGGIDYLGLARAGADQASQAIFRAIGREEAAIRADPRSTRDPALIALLAGSTLGR